MPSSSRLSQTSAPASTQTPIFLVGFWPDYETLFLRDVQFAEREVVIVNPLQSYKHSKNHKYLPRPIRNALYLSALKQHFRKYQEATFIFQDHRLILNAMLKYGAPTHSGIILRNICAPDTKTGKAIMALQANGSKIFSFDRADCQQYGFTFYNQFAAAVAQKSNPTPNYDFCFIGKNKGRDQLLNPIKAQANASGYSMRISYIGDTTGAHFQKQIAYTHYLELQLDCRCVVDINQQGQQGLTLRPLEAAMYGKKLLSNNQSLKKHALFHPDNILIMDTEMHARDLNTFMEKPVQPVHTEILQQHQPQAVFQNIVTSIDTQ